MSASYHRAGAERMRGSGGRPPGILSSVRRGRRRWKRLGRTANLAGAAVVSAVLLWVMAAGFGTVPPLGAALDAGRGAWTSAGGGRPATSQRRCACPACSTRSR